MIPKSLVNRPSTRTMASARGIAVAVATKVTMAVICGRKHHGAIALAASSSTIQTRQAGPKAQAPRNNSCNSAINGGIPFSDRLSGWEHRYGPHWGSSEVARIPALVSLSA